MQEVGWLKSEFLDDDEARRAQAHLIGVPFVLLEPADIDQEALIFIPEPFSRAHNAVAYKQSVGVVEVALLDLAELAALEALRLNVKILPRLTTTVAIKRALVKYQTLLKEKFGVGISEAVKGDRPAQLVDSLLRHALLARAGSVHIEPREKNLAVRYRLGGVLHDAMTLPLAALQGAVRRLKELAGLDAKVALPQEGRFKIKNDDSGSFASVRVSTSPTLFGERAVLHILPEHLGGGEPSLTSLGLHGSALDDIYSALHRRRGLFVVSGGGQNLINDILYALLGAAASADISIATIGEAPRSLQHAARMAVNKKSGLTSAVALRTALRQDADAVLIEDISEGDSAMLARAAAERGVLILAGIKDTDSARALSPDILVAVHTVKKLCAKCRAQQRSARAELEVLEDYVEFARVLGMLKDEQMASKTLAWKEVSFSSPVGCDECKHGYLGDVALHEVHIGGKAALALAEDGLFKAAQGLTSVEEVARVAALSAR